ncbi:MAG TPA: GNAT family N-acetyltransferase [Gaiellaceae bacterium]
MTQIRVAAGDDDLAHVVDLRRRIDDLTATTVEDTKVFHAQADGPLQLVADDTAFGFTAKFPGERDATLDVGVVPAARRQGIGAAFYDRLVEHAREAGWPSLGAGASEPEGIEWLRRRGFEEVDRQERVVLRLSDAPVEAPEPAVELTDFAARPDLAPKLHALVVEGLQDIPGALAEDVPTLEHWLSWQQAPSRRPSFLVIALEDDEPLGYAQLHVYPEVGYHGFTVTARRARRRGIGRALKLELIRRSRALGLERLITNSNVDNMPMRTLNAELGYRPAPARVYFRKAF